MPPTQSRPTAPGADPDVDAARVLLHRATAVVRSAMIEATAPDAPGDAEGSPPPPRPTADGTRVAQRREEHRALLRTHLTALGARFETLAGVPPPEAFAGRGGSAPSPEDAPADAGPPATLWTDIRRTEWAAYGLEAILRTYAARAPLAAAAVRRACADLRAWSVSARSEL